MRLAAGCLGLLLLLPLPAARAEADVPDVAAPGQEIVALIERRDAAGLSQRIDVDALLERVLDGASLSDGQRGDFAAGFRKSGRSAGANLMANIERNRATPRLVRSIAMPRGSRQIVRLDLHDAEGGVSGYDYLEFELGPDGRIRDWRSHVQAARASETMRLLVSSLFDSTTIGAWLFGEAKADLDGLEQMQAFIAAAKAGDFRAAHAALGRLPESFRKTRQWAGMRVGMSSNFDEAQYREDLAAIARDHGTDPEVQFMLVDHFTYTEQYDALVAAVQRFERRVVADGVTHMLKCVGHSSQAKWDDAERACVEATRIEPDFAPGWWALVDVHNGRRDARQLLGTLEEIERRFALAMDPDVLVKLDGYTWLADEPAFADWAEDRR